MSFFYLAYIIPILEFIMISHTYCPYLLLIVLRLLITSAWHIHFGSCLLLSLILFKLHLILVDLCLLLLWWLNIRLIKIFNHKHVSFCMQSDSRVDRCFPWISKHDRRKYIWIFCTKRRSYCSNKCWRNALINAYINLILILYFLCWSFNIFRIISSLFLKFFLATLGLMSCCIAHSFF